GGDQRPRDLAEPGAPNALVTWLWSCGHGISLRASAVDHLLRAFGVPVSVHRDPRGSRIDLTQVVRRELDVCRAEVLLQPVKLRRAGNRYDPGPLRQHPG